MRDFEGDKSRSFRARSRARQHFVDDDAKGVLIGEEG
jgi:hypothetical protein